MNYVEGMLDDDNWYEAQVEGMTLSRRTPIEKEKFKNIYLDYVSKNIASVSSYNVPLSVVHGDFNPLNIFSGTEKSFEYIDFASCSISYPFLDIVQLRDVSGIDEESINCYLNEWTSFEPMSRLTQLIELITNMDEIIGFILMYKRYSLMEPSERVEARDYIKFCVLDTVK